MDIYDTDIIIIVKSQLNSPYMSMNKLAHGETCVQQDETICNTAPNHLHGQVRHLETLGCCQGLNCALRMVFSRWRCASLRSRVSSGCFTAIWFSELIPNRLEGHLKKFRPQHSTHKAPMLDWLWAANIFGGFGVTDNGLSDRAFDPIRVMPGKCKHGTRCRFAHTTDSWGPVVLCHIVGIFPGASKPGHNPIRSPKLKKLKTIKVWWKQYQD